MTVFGYIPVYPLVNTWFDLLCQMVSSFCFIHAASLCTQLHKEFMRCCPTAKDFFTQWEDMAPIINNWAVTKSNPMASVLVDELLADGKRSLGRLPANSSLKPGCYYFCILFYYVIFVIGLVSCCRKLYCQMFLFLLLKPRFKLNLKPVYS